MSAEQCRQLDDNNLECCDGDLCNKGECYGDRSSLQFTCRTSAQYINLSLDIALFASLEPSDKNNTIYNNNNHFLTTLSSKSTSTRSKYEIEDLRMKFGEITVHMPSIKKYQGSGKLCDMMTSSDVIYRFSQG